MVPVCPSCGSLAVGDRCGSCGKPITRPSPPSASSASSSDGTPGSGMPALTLGLGLDLNQSGPGTTGAGTSSVPAMAAGTVESQKKHRQAAAYLKLEESEQAVLQAASRIFAAFIASGKVTDENQHALSDKSVQLATRMAVVIEKYIQSDNEDW